jgi:hypothetical protein
MTGIPSAFSDLVSRRSSAVNGPLYSQSCKMVKRAGPKTSSPLSPVEEHWSIADTRRTSVNEMIAIASADHVRGSETRPVVRHHGCPKRITITVLNPGNYVAFDICNGSRHKNGSTIDRRRPSSVRRSEVPRRDHGDCRFSSRRGFWDAPFAVLDCNLDNVQ